MHEDLKSLFLTYAGLDAERAGIAIARSGAKAERFTVGAIARAAAGFAQAFAQVGVRAGDRVVIAHATSLEFIGAFWGCHLVSAVPVPTYPAIPGSRVGMGLARLEGIFRRCRPAALVTLPILAEVYRGEGLALPPLVTDPVSGADFERFAAAAPPDARAPALIQFTSGSTSEPKGCVLSHRAVLANTRAVLDAFGEVKGVVSRQVSWLPMYHDMGLMAGVLFPFLYAAEGHWKSDEEVSVLQPPEEFIVDPLSWLRLLDEHRANYTFAPNFALQLIARKLAARPESFDLSSLRTLLTGAEPVDPAVVRAFEGALAPSGLRAGTVRPAWGLAENVVFGTISPAGMRVDRLSRRALESEGVARPCADDSDAVEIPSLGSIHAGGELRVVGDDGTPVRERIVGEIELRSDSLIDGYYEDPEATAEVLRD
ncbi:MAG: AMP-binding protein, partial [Myxococcales bacterium]|nr:AMP-binding protein [Myxococcales bacterium]